MQLNPLLLFTALVAASCLVFHKAPVWVWVAVIAGALLITHLSCQTCQQRLDGIRRRIGMKIIPNT